jgi:thiol:disulfide interchange protein DsbD
MRAAEERRCEAVTALAIVAALFAGLSASAQVNPLPPEKAFRFSARLVDAQTVEARFMIADGYYLYRDKIHFAIEPAAAGLTVPRLPEGKMKEDQFFGRVETYRGDVVVKLAVKDPKPGQQIVIAAESQGCADIGICYPPNVQRVMLALPAGSVIPGASGDSPKKSWFN